MTLRQSAYAVAALACAVMASLFVGWCAGNKYGKPRTVEKWNAVYRAMPTRAAEKWRTQVVERLVRVPVLTEREERRLEDEWELDVAGPGDAGNPPEAPTTGTSGDVRPAPPVEVLGERELPALPHGGKGMFTLSAAGDIDLLIRANPPPAVRLPMEPYVRVGSGMFVPLEGTAQPAWTAMLGAELVELPRLRTRLSAEAGWLDLGDRRRGWLVLGTVRVGLR